MANLDRFFAPEVVDAIRREIRSLIEEGDRERRLLSFPASAPGRSRTCTDAL
jgi:hypothetical protein